jgi:hypothetical protein
MAIVQTSNVKTCVPKHTLLSKGIPKMRHVNKKVSPSTLLGTLGRVWTGVVLLIVISSGYGQAQITNPNPPTVSVPSTVGRITKWTGQNNGRGIIGDSVITESAGNIGIGVVNPNFRLVVAGAIRAAALGVSGNVTALDTVSGDIVNAATQYNIGGSRVLSNAGSFNLFAGVGAGQNNTTGSNNSFFGFEAGRDNTDGGTNSFFGFQAGSANTTGDRNSFFGFLAGTSNTTGRQNAFFGESAGRENTTGGANSFFGRQAGIVNTTGQENSFFGFEAGENNTTGSGNSFFGLNAGNGNVTGTNLTMIGLWSDVLADGLDHATAIGADAKVLFSNFIVLGRSLGEDTVHVPGDLIVGGNVTKGSGSFKIDYPLDPANKTLSHSFVESPDMMNIYNGNLTTDTKGQAVVTLPEYFQALNRDFRYQLTVIGEFAQAIVAREIKDNRFSIKTNKPNVKVSWQITGIRQDAYANANRIQVVESKGERRGTYLHPELFKTSSPSQPVTGQQ